MNNEQAETIALQALAFIAEDERALSGFLATTGTHPAHLKNIASDTSALAGVLEFLMHNEDRLVNFCEAAALAPGAPGKAFAVLEGRPGL